MGSDYSVVSRSGSADRVDTVATIHRISRGAASPWLYAEVEKIVDRVGPGHSECHVTVRNLSRDDEEAVALCLQGPDGQLSPPQLPGGSRIKVLADEGDTILFAGELARVAEFNRAGAVRLVFHDDKSYLDRIPIAGTFIYDTEADVEKLVPRLPLRWNPEGRGNCLRILSEGNDEPMPMFSHVSFARAAMDALPYTAGDENVFPTFWTPARALVHLCYRLFYYDWDSAPEAFRHTPRVDTQKVEWPGDSLNFASPEMLKKLPDPGNALNGKSFSEILSEILEATGMYHWRLGYKNDNYGTSVIQIVPRVRPEAQQVQAAQTADPPVRGIDIEIQRGGDADDINTAYDFQSERDYSRTVTQVHVEGAPIEIEAEFKYENGADDTLEPAWNADDQAAHTAIIMGTGGGGTYARVDDVDMDGTNGRPKVLINTIEAVQLARAEYPLVWRAFKLKRGTKLDTVMKGGVGEPLLIFFDWLLQHFRPFAGEDQAQRIFDENGIETDERYQVRIQVDPGCTGAAYHTVHANPGLRPTARGLIFIDGLTDELAAQDNLYNGSLIMDPLNVSLKWIKINAVVNHDARCRSVAALQAVQVEGAVGLSTQDPNLIAPELDPSWLQVGMGPSAYGLASADIDHPEGFRQQYQVASYPSAKSSYGVDSEGQPIESPLNRPLRDDQADLDAVAAKRLRDKARVGHVDAWRYIGIRPEFRAGTFIDRIATKGSTSPVQRAVNAAIVETTFHINGPQVSEIKLEGF